MPMVNSGYAQTDHQKENTADRAVVANILISGSWKNQGVTKTIKPESLRKAMTGKRETRKTKKCREEAPPLEQRWQNGG